MEWAVGFIGCMDPELRNDGVIESAFVHAECLRSELNKLRGKACEWKRDGDGGYYVKCGDFRVKTTRQRDYDDDGPAHVFTFCPYCGGRMTVTANMALCVNKETT